MDRIDRAFRINPAAANYDNPAYRHYREGFKWGVSGCVAIIGGLAVQALTGAEASTYAAYLGIPAALGGGTVLTAGLTGLPATRQ